MSFTIKTLFQSLEIEKLSLKSLLFQHCERSEQRLFKLNIFSAWNILQGVHLLKTDRNMRRSQMVDKSKVENAKKY